MASTKVVVVGAKPDSVSVRGDVYFLANGALAFKSQLPEGRFFHVIDGAALRIDYREGKAAPDVVDTLRRALSSGEVDSTYVLDADIHAVAYMDRPIAILERLGYRTGYVRLLARSEMFDSVASIIGRRPPFGYRYIFKSGLRNGAYYLRVLIKFFVKKYLLGYEDQFPEKFRPSAGVLALIAAITEYGRDAEYVVSGIGLDVSVKYNYGAGVFTSPKRTRGHLFADWYVLKRVAKHYQVSTPDRELSRRTGIPSASDNDVFFVGC